MTAGTAGLRDRLSRRQVPIGARPPVGARPVPRARARQEVRGPQRERHEPDYVIVFVTVALAAIGLLMVYSTTGVAAAIRNGGDPFAGVVMQLCFSLVGLAGLVFFMRLDFRLLRHVSVPGYVAALGLLVIVLLPPIGLFQPVSVGGSARWLEIGSLPAVHPAELAKLALVIYLAHWLASIGVRVKSLTSGLLRFLAIVAPAILLVAREPDLGTTGVLTLSAFTVFFVAGARIWHLLLLIPVGVAAVAAYVLATPYQTGRVDSFVAGLTDPLAAGFQTVQGLLALAVGGLFGIGLGQSQQPGSLVVPNAQNDFIFAVIGQEFGLVGAIVVIGLFLLLGYRGIHVALSAPDRFSGLLATGITAWLTFQALINIGVVVALLPITGITLPFVSDGGSSLVVSFAAIGILLSISRETQPRGTWNDAHPDSGRRYGRPHLPGPGRSALPAGGRR